jgi:hypothetical protein
VPEKVAFLVDEHAKPRLRRNLSSEIVFARKKNAIRSLAANC